MHQGGNTNGISKLFCILREYYWKIDKQFHDVAWAKLRCSCGFSSVCESLRERIPAQLVAGDLALAGCQCCFTAVGCCTEWGELHKLSCCSWPQQNELFLLRSVLQAEQFWTARLHFTCMSLSRLLEHVHSPILLDCLLSRDNTKTGAYYC